ncbi:hypothetical protein [Pedobacter sp.]|uniref:hypothetical protein n=1 Tax=Pedobacter sp. TaxID=1411316 RepID=UPI003D7F2F48
MSYPTIISNPVIQDEDVPPWGRDYQNNIVEALIDPTFYGIDILKQTHLKYSNQFSQIAPSYTQSELLERAFYPPDPYDIQVTLAKICKAFNVIDKKTLAIKSKLNPEGGIEFIFYFHPIDYTSGKSIVQKIVTQKQCNPALAKHLEAFRKVSPTSRFHYSSALKAYDKLHATPNMSASDPVQDIFSDFLNKFDLIIDLSNCALYKRNYDIVLESVLEQNCHLEQAPIFDVELLKKCVNDFTSQQSQNGVNSHVIHKIYIYSQHPDKKPKLMSRFKKGRCGNNKFPAEYAAAHKYLLIAACNHHISIDALIDMEKLGQLSKDKTANLAVCVLEYEKRFRQGKLKKKYVLCAKERTCGSPYYHLSIK